jgi:hypothetical protein
MRQEDPPNMMSKRHEPTNRAPAMNPDWAAAATEERQQRDRLARKELAESRRNRRQAHAAVTPHADVARPVVRRHG